jgi:hypothetical protein
MDKDKKKSWIDGTKNQIRGADTPLPEDEGFDFRVKPKQNSRTETSASSTFKHRLFSFPGSGSKKKLLCEAEEMKLSCENSVLALQDKSPTFAAGEDYIVRGSTASIILKRLGKLDESKLKDFFTPVSSCDGNTAVFDSESDEHDEPKSALPNYSAGEEETLGLEATRVHKALTPKVCLRHHVVPQRRLEVGATVSVSHGTNRGLKGQIHAALKSEGWFLIKSTDGRVASVHGTQLEVHRGQESKRKRCLAKPIQSLGKPSASVKAVFLGMLSRSNKLSYDIAKTAFRGQGLDPRKKRKKQSPGCDQK